MDEVILSPLLKDLAKHVKEEGEAAEDLRQALNGIIGRYKLHPSVVISLLARISAAYIQLTQKVYDKQNADEVVEEDFQNFLTASLTSIDMSEFNAELEKRQNGNLN
jgi:hypothetical protein